MKYGADVKKLAANNNQRLLYLGKNGANVTVHFLDLFISIKY